jgi:hypothetical protein
VPGAVLAELVLSPLVSETLPAPVEPVDDPVELGELVSVELKPPDELVEGVVEDAPLRLPVEELLPLVLP